MRALFCAVLVLCSGCSSVGHLGSADDAGAAHSAYGVGQAYVGANVIGAFERFHFESVVLRGDYPWVGDRPTAENVVGGNVRFGYRAHKHIAVELLGEFYDKVDVELFGVEYAEIVAWALMANAKVYVTDRQAQPYIGCAFGALTAEAEDKFGLGLTDEESEVVIRPSIGVDIYLIDRLAIDVEAAYMFPTGDIDDYQFWTLGAGLQLRF